MNAKEWMHITDEDGEEIAVQIKHITHIVKVNDRVCSADRSKIVLIDGTFVILNAGVLEIINTINEANQQAAKEQRLRPAKEGDKYLQECIQTYGMLCGMHAKGEVDASQVEEAWEAVLEALGVQEALNDEP